MKYELKAKGKSGLGAELLIYGDIGQSWDAEESNDAKTVTAALKSLKAGPLAVRINSFGGSVADGLAIYNAIRRHPGEVTTHIDGVAYSIASLIAMAGHEVRIAANGMLMIHAPWGMAVGNAPEMREMADILDKHAEAMIASYVRDGGPDTDQIRSWLTDGEDHYFTASEAIELGMVDSVDDAAPVFEIAAALRASGRQFSIPAAPRRSTVESANMAEEQTTGASAVTPATDMAAPLAAHSRTVKTAMAAGVAAEKKRRGDISSVFAEFYDADPLNPISALHDECMDDEKCDELGARRKLLAMLAAQTADPVLAPQHYAVQPQAKAPPQSSRHLGGAMLLGADASDKRAKGLQAALSIKSGLVTDRNVIDAERKGEFLSMSLIDIMAGELRTSGYPVAGSREDIARRYVQSMPILAAGPSHGTDHLPSVLGNIANLSAMQGWEGSAETWSQWTQAGTLNNYQTATRANIALLDKLTKMLENQEWEYGDLADVKQRITGYFYGLKYSLSIQAIVNDDLGELTRTMSGWGEAASATVGDAVWAVLFTAGSGGYGQSMDEDSTVLFHANHSNYVASGSGAAPSESTLNTARAAMLTQSDPNGRKVAAIPRYILHGPSLWSTVRKVLSSQDLNSVTVDGATGATVLTGSSNTVPAMNLVPVEEYRLVASAPAATVWVLAANRRTVEVAGVGGPVAPRAEQSMVSNTPGITYELSMPFGVAALDYRGLYLNFGA